MRDLAPLVSRDSRHPNLSNPSFGHECGHRGRAKLKKS